MNIYLIFLLLFFSFTPLWACCEEPVRHLTLKQALLLADKHNAQVLAAHQRILQSLANTSAAKAPLLPQLTGTFGVKRQTTDLRASGINIPGDPHVGPFNSLDARAHLTMAIFDPEARQRLMAAKAGEQLSTAQLSKVRQDIFALVASLFLEAQRAQEAVSLAELSLQQMQFEYQLMETRLKQGTATESDVQKLKVDLAQAQYAKTNALVRANQTRLDLVSVLNINLDQAILFDHDHTLFSKDLRQAKITADMAIAQAQVVQSRAQQAAAKSDFLPKVNASLDAGRLGKSFNDASNTYGLGLGISVPFWEGGSKQAKLKEAESRTKENEILFNDTKDQTEIKIRQARNNIIQAEALLRAKAQQVSYAQMQEAIVLNRLKSGLGHVLEAKQAELFKAMAIDAKNEAQALYWTSKVNLAHALGAIEEMFDIKQENES